MNRKSGNRTHLVVVVGIRSQYIKLAALQSAFNSSDVFRSTYIDTGQHYDSVLAAQYISEYGLRFDKLLECGSVDHTPTDTLACMLVTIEAALANCRPDGVLVFGDANTTLAAALAARRLGIRVAHLEAGVRTGAETPEELNRTVVDGMATLHMAASRLDLLQLRSEGFGSSSTFVGDVVRDLCLDVEPERIGHQYGLITIHRAENTRDCAVVRAAVDVLAGAGIRPVVVFHPRVLRLVRAQQPGLLTEIISMESVSHARILRLIKGARIVITDSGALQRESYYLGRRAVIVQDQPFWRCLVDAGYHIAVGPTGDFAGAVASALLPAPEGVLEFGSAGVANRVTAALEKWL